MTTRTGSRVYRGIGTPLAAGACPHCGRVIAIDGRGRRRRHFDGNSRPCTGGGVMVGGPEPVRLDRLPRVVMPRRRKRAAVTVREPRPQREKPPDPRRCICGQRPRRKDDGTFVAHRVDGDNPVSSYCEGGSTRSY